MRGGVGDGRGAADLARGVEAGLAVLGRAAAVDVEERRDDVEGEVVAAQVEHRGGDVVLEVDHRRPGELDAALRRSVAQADSASRAYSPIVQTPHLLRLIAWPTWKRRP